MLDEVVLGEVVSVLDDVDSVLDVVGTLLELVNGGELKEELTDEK